MTEVKLGLLEGSIGDSLIEVRNERLTIKDTGMGGIGFWSKDGKNGKLLVEYRDIPGVIQILEHILKEAK